MPPFGSGRNVQSHSHQTLTQILQEMYNIFLRGRELILISSDVTAMCVLSAIPERIFSRPFPEKSSKLPFQNFDVL